MVDPKADKFGFADDFLDNSQPSHSLMAICPETAVPRLPNSHWTSLGDRYSRTGTGTYLETKSSPSARQPSAKGTPAESFIVLG